MKRKTKICGECYWRDYGTDSHFVCQEGDKNNWFRVNRKSPACPKFKRKVNPYKNRVEREGKKMKEYPDVVREMPDIFALIRNEHWKQFEKWGVQKKTLFEWLCYLTKEVGELAKAISEQNYRKGTIKDIKKEATQVAALACKIIAILS